MTDFKDHFSSLAEAYSRHRPRYPTEMFAYLAEQAPARELAWDCATGSGQAAAGLAEHFLRVVATDASGEQLRHAAPHPRVEYRAAPAEHCGLPEASADLVTVAQALHWFDFEAFFPEVRRVLRPGGRIAAWTYGLMRIDAPVDAVIDRLYWNDVGAFWPPERSFIEHDYRTIPFPFEEQSAPLFSMQAEWRLADLIGYLGTWSAVQRFKEAREQDPVAHAAPALGEAWGDPERVKPVLWTLPMRMGRV